jgi:C4-dicarboxylate-specific signal transduction histidine kinase
MVLSVASRVQPQHLPRRARDYDRLRAGLDAQGKPLAHNGDRVQLQQVILNLLRNASEAMSGVVDRPREVAIRTERDGLDRVRLSVHDTGTGLNGDVVERVFDAFFTTKGQRHGHRARVFCFSIPCRPDSVAAALSLGAIPGLASPALH